MHTYNQIPSCIYAVRHTKQSTPTTRCHHAPPLSASFVCVYECFIWRRTSRICYNMWLLSRGQICSTTPCCMLVFIRGLVMPLPRMRPTRRSLLPDLFGDLTHRANGHNISACRRPRLVSRPCLKLSDSYGDPLRRVIATDTLRISYVLLLLHVLPCCWRVACFFSFSPNKLSLSVDIIIYFEILQYVVV